MGQKETSPLARTRAAVITFLWRMEGRPEPKTMATFKDMPDDPDFAKAISWGGRERDNYRMG